MAKPLIDDDLWDLLQPLLPEPKPRRSRYPGRKLIQVLKKSYIRTLDKWHQGRDTARCCEAIQVLEGFLRSEARMEVFVSVNPMPSHVPSAWALIGKPLRH